MNSLRSYYIKKITMHSVVASFALCSLLFALSIAANAADVVARPTTAVKTATRARPVATSAIRASATATTTPVAEQVVTQETTEVITETPTIDSERLNKFSTALDGQSAATTESDLKDLIMAQRVADKASVIVSSGTILTGAGVASGRNSCDENLRSCMKEKCGDNFTNCALDTDLLWGEKIESCRLTAKCTGAEYAAFAPEIKSDRDAQQLLGGFVTVQSCGAEYNECIVTGCGTQFDKCLGKSAGDKIISDCSAIAEKCRTADSGLASRAMNVLGTLRQDAEKQVVTDEEQLYSLREQMANKCKGLGAMFDDRSMNCVFTVEMFAPSSENSLASRKVSAGNSFDCTQEWFGVDVTTYKEDAARLTREQKAATSALMGAGAGTLGGIGVNKIAPLIGAGNTDNVTTTTEEYKADESTGNQIASKAISGVSGAAMGVGGMQLAQGLSEQKSDKAATAEMQSYLSGMYCIYGVTNKVAYGTVGVTTTEQNQLDLLRKEFLDKAAKLKNTKEQLGLKAGIESEVVFDKSETGLYSNEKVNRADSYFGRLSSALQDENGRDAQMLDAQSKTSKNRVIGGAIAVGAGAAASIGGNALLNKIANKKADEQKIINSEPVNNL